MPRPIRPMNADHVRLPHHSARSGGSHLAYRNQQLEPLGDGGQLRAVPQEASPGDVRPRASWRIAPLSWCIEASSRLPEPASKSTSVSAATTPGRSGPRAATASSGTTRSLPEHDTRRLVSRPSPSPFSRSAAAAEPEVGVRILERPEGDDLAREEERDGPVGQHAHLAVQGRHPAEVVGAVQRTTRGSRFSRMP